MFVRNALEIKGKYLMKCSFRFTIIRLVDLHTCPIRTLSAATPGLSIFRGFLKGFSENFILIFGHLFIVNNLNRLLIVIFLVVLWDPCYQSDFYWLVKNVLRNWRRHYYETQQNEFDFTNQSNSCYSLLFQCICKICKWRHCSFFL